MDRPNAFIGKPQQPTSSEVTAALGPAAPAWDDFVQWMASAENVSTQEWKDVYVKKYGWTLRLKQKNRNIVYLSPCRGCFRVGFVLSDKAIALAREQAFPKPVATAIAEAPHYPEGNGVRLTVKSLRDLGPIRRLAEIKLSK